MNTASTPPSSFPSTRLRRLRRSPWIRRLVAESQLSADDLIYPMFVIEGDNKSESIPSMPGIKRYSIDGIVKEARNAKSIGIPMIALFPYVDESLKSADAEESANPDNLICRTVRSVKRAIPEIGVMCDVALDPYSSHGHDGLLKEGIVVNDETLNVLCEQALVQAKAGCDVIAPSDMMDGRVGAIRAALDKHGFQDIPILAYAAKYASAFYGPFREAIGSGKSLSGDKKTYQMNPANSAEAIREVALDISEGADMVMVKPGLPYLDVIVNIKQRFGVPTFAYQVSGEYAMITAAVEREWLDRESTVLESLISFKRAGANGILTYFALEAAGYLKNPKS